MKIPELHQHILKSIQGVFGESDMEVMKREIEKLKPGQVYLEMGVDEGRSFTTAHHYAKPGVFIVGVDIHDVPPHELSVGRGPWAEAEGMIGIGKYGFFVHGDGDLLAEIWTKPIHLLFLDPHHDYESIKSATLAWEPKMAKGGVILFHDYDHAETKRWLDEHYGDNKIQCNNKIIKVEV